MTWPTQALLACICWEYCRAPSLLLPTVFYQLTSGMEDGTGSPLGAGAGEAGGRPLRGQERPELKYAETLQVCALHRCCCCCCCYGGVASSLREHCCA